MEGINIYIIGRDSIFDKSIPSDKTYPFIEKCDHMFSLWKKPVCQNFHHVTFDIKPSFKRKILVITTPMSNAWLHIWCMQFLWQDIFPRIIKSKHKTPGHLTGSFAGLLLTLSVFVPRPSRKRGTLKLIHLSVPLSVRQSVTKTLTWLISSEVLIKTDRALIFGMHDCCVKPFKLTPRRDLDLWPTQRSKLLPGGGPQFFKFACLIYVRG